MTKRNLGAIKRSYDNRDLSLGAISAPQSLWPTPKAYSSDVSNIRHYYQNGWTTCGAHSGAALKSFQEFRDTGMTDGCSPRFLWNQIKKIDGYGIYDGTDMRSIFKTLSGVGDCHYTTMPDDHSLVLSEYSVVDAAQMDKASDEAGEAIIDAYGFLPNGFTLQDLKDAIYRYHQVLMLIRCDDGFFGNKIPTFSTKKYCHFVVAYGFDEEKIYILDSTEAVSSTDEKVIMNCYFPFIQEVGTAVDAGTLLVRGMIKKKNILTKLVELYKQLIAYKNKKFS